MGGRYCQSEQRWLQQHQPFHALRVASGKGHSDCAASGVADRMRSIDRFRCQTCRPIANLGCVDAGAGRHTGFAAVVAAQIGQDQVKAIGKGVLVGERVTSGQGGVKQHDRRAAAQHSVAQNGAIARADTPSFPAGCQQ